MYEVKKPIESTNWEGALVDHPENVLWWGDCFHKPKSNTQPKDYLHRIISIIPPGYLRPVFCMIVQSRHHGYNAVEIPSKYHYDLNGCIYQIYDRTDAFIGRPDALFTFDETTRPFRLLKNGVDKFRYNQPERKILASEFPKRKLAPIYEITRWESIRIWVRTRCCRCKYVKLD